MTSYVYWHFSRKTGALNESLTPATLPVLQL